MQRGPLLQPLRSTELVLSGPPRARKLAGLSTGRLTAAHTASASKASFFSHWCRSEPPFAPHPPARRGWPRCCVRGPRRRAEWGLPQMVFLIAEYRNKRLVAGRALAAVHAVSTTVPAPGYGEYATTLRRKLPLRVFAVPAPLRGKVLSTFTRSTEEANPPSGRVFLSAFAVQKPHSFPSGKPRFAPLPPRRIRLTPFPQSGHGFVLCRNRASPEVQPISYRGGVTSPVRVPLSLPILRPRLRLFQKAQKCRTGGNPARAPLPINSRSLPVVSLDRRLRKQPLRVFAVPAPLRGMVFHPSRRRERLTRSGGNETKWSGNHRKNFCALRLCEAESSEYWKIRARRSKGSVFDGSPCWNVEHFSKDWKMGPPAARAPRWGPHKMGPRALRALLFPDIYRETETP
jgi:hypothetical protein